MADLSIGLLGRSAVQAFLRHDEKMALDRLLEAWRHSRGERLAELVERLSLRLAAKAGPGAVASGGLVSSQSQRIPKRLLLDDLMKTAEQGLPEVLSRRLRVLHQCPADPRFTPGLLALAHLPAARSPEVAQQLCGLFEAQSDPRVIQPLTDLHASLKPGSRYARRLTTTLERLKAHEQMPLRPELESQCEELEAALARREASETAREELLARVYADPEDVAARMVLADHLLEQGDPLGEFIMLQCSPGVDGERISQFLSVRGAQWSTVLGPHVEHAHTRFEQGFPVAVRLSRRWMGSLPEPTQHWRTVREVDVNLARSPRFAEWLSHPCLRGVTTLKRVTPATVRGLAARQVGVRQLEWSDSAPISRELFTHLGRLPKLERLFIHEAMPVDVHRCAASRLASTLAHFEARSTGQWALVWMPAEDVPLRATLLGAEGVMPLAQALRGAVGFGARALHVDTGRFATRDGLRLLNAVASVYASVEWS